MAERLVAARDGWPTGRSASGPEGNAHRRQPPATVQRVPETHGIVAGAVRLAERLGNEAYYAALCLRSGVVGIEPPHKVAQMLLELERYGTLGALSGIAAIRHRDHLVMVDDLGEITYGELGDRVNALATAWIEEGLEAGDGVALLARNHRGLLVALFAAARCGAKIILLNTGFSGPQIREVCEREGADLLVYDEEFEHAVGDYTPRLGRLRGWLTTRHNADDTLIALITSTQPKAPPKPKQAPRLVILTSGTTGTPKGADRDVPMSLAPVGGVLSKVPFRARGVTQLCAPIFHALGFSQMLLGVALGSTLVVARRFDPVDVLDSLESNRATTMIVVPVMLQRILAAAPTEYEGRDFRSLKIIFVSGSALSADLAARAMKVFGPVVYNLYGSTEVAYATVATPADMIEAPGTVGQIVHGTVVKLLDADGVEVPAGQTGRIFVGNAIGFDGYTGGGDKERIAGLVSSGDVGHFDGSGRLFIDGRDDDMIVSGGENVFPAEVEELIATHPSVLEVAVLGVPDDEFGQRLKAFVVKRTGESALDEDAVKNFVKENLANYKVPREVEFLRELPRNATGKVLKRELK
jgi:fatty-acyl-CoA synthase